MAQLANGRNVRLYSYLKCPFYDTLFILLHFFEDAAKMVKRLKHLIDKAGTPAEAVGVAPAPKVSNFVFCWQINVSNRCNCAVRMTLWTVV